MPIIDAHHHLWARAPLENAGAYLIPELLDDVNAGHKIVATVYVECGSGYREDGAVELRPVGETEFVAHATAQPITSAPAQGLCAAIVGFADLRLGDAVDRVLEAHVDAGRGRFRGIRQMGARDENAPLDALPHRPQPGLLCDPAFRRGFSQLGRRGLCFDAFVFHPQLHEVADLARAFPDVPIVVNHVGGLIGVGKYAHQRAAEIERWRASLSALADLANVYMKIGGLGMFLGGSPLLHRDPAAGADEIAHEWQPAIEFAIEKFGPSRCMFESNFPVDSATCSYLRLWNVFKLVCRRYSATEKQHMFHDTAARFYRLQLD
ncbi:MAG: amidohydrolase family protein [Steroidobacteraceae bacterium]